MSIWSAEIKELEKLTESFKGQLPELEKELERLIKADDENMILLYSRRCLEVIINELCECELKRSRKTEPLQGIIDKLHKEEKIPSHIIASMQSLNTLSTFGVHPKEFDTEQIKPVLSNLAIIIKWYLRYKAIDIKPKDEKKIQFEGKKSEGVKKESGIEQQEKNVMLIKNRLIFGVLITVFVVIAVLIAYPKIFKPDMVRNIRSSGERISVAVLPFQNMTNDTTWNIWQSGIQDMLITSLSNYPEELIVRQSGSINNLINNRGITNYASMTPAIAGSISQKLDVNVFVYGNIKVAGSILRIVAQLIDSETEVVFKSFQIEGSATEENIFQISDSVSGMIKDFLLISKLIKKENPGIIKYAATTKSPDAFKNTIRGNDVFYKKRDFPASINLYMKALAIDSNYLWPAIMISYAYLNQSLYDEGKKWLQKLYEKRDLMPVIYKTWVNTLHAIYFETDEESIKCMKQLLEIDDQLPDILADIGYVYNLSEKYSQAIPELEKGFEIYKKWGIHPTWVFEYTNLGLAYHKTGQYLKEKQLYKKAETDFPDSPEIIYRQAVLSLAEKDTLAANRYIDKYKLLSKENSIQDIEITTNLAAIYSEADILDRAEEYYRKAILSEPEKPVRINTLAYFLIDKERNITEGLKLADNLLELNPDNYNFLYTKGLGLLKQGKYNEASEILQKSWDLRMKNAIYDHKAYLYLEAARKAASRQN